MAQFLLSHGAAVDKTSHNVMRYSPLHAACIADNTAVAKFLVWRGASLIMLSEGLMFDAGLMMLWGERSPWVLVGPAYRIN